MIFDSGKQRGLIRRPLRFAVLASLAVHALLLAMGTVRPAAQEAAPRLLASFRPAPAAVSPAPSAPPAVAPVRPHVGHREILRRAVRAESFPEPSSDGAKDSKLPGVSPTPTFPTPVTVPPITNIVPADASPSAEHGATEPPVSGLSADGLRRYRLSLAVQSRRFKRYPAQALASGWVGTAEIHLQVGSDGQGTATLSRSSGYVALDHAAQTMVEAGAQHTPVPEALRGKAFSVVLPVLFDISDGG